MKYADIRSTLVTGDVILWENDGLWGWVSSPFTKFSHVSMVRRIQDCFDATEDYSVMVVEALGSGVELRRLSRKLENYKGKAYLLQTDCTVEEVREISRFLTACVGDGIAYDYRDMLRNIIKRPKLNNSKFYCSELVWAALVHAQKVLDIGKAPTPGDLPEWLGAQPIEITF